MDFNKNALGNKYVLSLPLKSVTVFTDLVAKRREFQSFGAGYVKERSSNVALDNGVGQLRRRLIRAS